MKNLRNNRKCCSIESHTCNSMNNHKTCRSKHSSRTTEYQKPACACVHKLNVCTGSTVCVGGKPRQSQTRVCPHARRKKISANFVATGAASEILPTLDIHSTRIVVKIMGACLSRELFFFADSPTTDTPGTELPIVARDGIEYLANRFEPLVVETLFEYFQ